MGQPLTLDEIGVSEADAAQVIYDLRRQLVDGVTDVAALRHDERRRVAALIEDAADTLVDFTGGSTLNALALVVFLLRLEQE